MLWTGVGNFQKTMIIFSPNLCYMAKPLTSHQNKYYIVQ